MNDIQLLNQRITLLENLLFAVMKSDKYYFGKQIVLTNGANMSFSPTTGTKIGTSVLQKIGFYNATPVIQHASIAAPSGGGVQDVQARSTIATIIETLGSTSGIGITA